MIKDALCSFKQVQVVEICSQDDSQKGHHLPNQLCELGVIEFNFYGLSKSLCKPWNKLFEEVCALGRVICIQAILILAGITQNISYPFELIVRLLLEPHLGLERGDGVLHFLQRHLKPFLDRKIKVLCLPLIFASVFIPLVANYLIVAH